MKLIRTILIYLYHLKIEARHTKIVWNHDVLL